MQPIFSVVGVVLVLTALLLGVSPTARRVTLWAAGVAVAYGFWVVAPISLRTHHLHPETVNQWITVTAFFTAVFLAWGLVLGAVSSWPVAVYVFVRRRPDTVSPAFAVLWLAAALPIGYVAVAVGIELSVFSRLVSLDALVRFSIVASVVATALGVVYAYAARRTQTVRGVIVAALLAAVCGTGLGALIVRNRSVAPARGDSTIPALVRRPTVASNTPLLVIGMDGGSWRLLQPLIEQGRTPTFQRIAGSMRGTVEALWPPYWSTPAWGAILTGYGIDALGVHEDLAAAVEGLPLFELPLTLDLAQNPVYLIELALIRAHVIEAMPVPRGALRRPPVWERLSGAGAKTAVIRFPFTHPVGQQADIVVSNRVVTDLWDLMGVRVGRREDLIRAPRNPEALLAWFDERFEPDESALKAILPPGGWPKPSDAVLDPSEVAEKIFTTGQRMFSLTEHVIREHPDLDVVMLHVTDLDNISHAFWPYRFPGDFPDEPPAAADIVALGPVLDRYAEYVDRQIARLIAAFPAEPNVLVVSDHGQEAAPSTFSMWKGWHSSRGVFMAAGPDIDARGADLAVSYFDIVPTILDLLSFEQPADLSGHSLLPKAAAAE